MNLDSILVRDQELQVLQCMSCGEIKHFSRGLAANPERMALLAEAVSDDHAECRQWLGDPVRAARQRRVKVAMRRELEKLRCGKRMF